ncbi:hypothetical protein LXL04_007518 [Taraxacum kok-saghyz]
MLFRTCSAICGFQIIQTAHVARFAVCGFGTKLHRSGLNVWLQRQSGTFAFVENGFSKIGVRFDKQIPQWDDLGGICEQDHAEFLRLDSSSSDDFEKLAIHLFEVCVTSFVCTAQTTRRPKAASPSSAPLIDRLQHQSSPVFSASDRSALLSSIQSVDFKHFLPISVTSFSHKPSISSNFKPQRSISVASFSLFQSISADFTPISSDFIRFLHYKHRYFLKSEVSMNAYLKSECYEYVCLKSEL